MASRSSRLEPTIEALVEEIVARVQPELVLLFGSRAGGNARDDSDYDLMLVVRDGENPESARKAAYEAARTGRFEVDVLARTATDYQRWQHDPGFLDWLVARDGFLLYASGAIAQRSPRADRVSEKPTEGLDAWVRRAWDHYRAAATLMASSQPPLAAICHASHASVEQLLKALIISSGTYPPKIHSLATLLQRNPALGSDTDLLADCELLDDLYPKSRYEPHPMPTPDEARAAFAAATRSRSILLAVLGRPEEL